MLLRSAIDVVSFLARCSTLDVAIGVCVDRALLLPLRHCLHELFELLCISAGLAVMASGIAHADRLMIVAHFCLIVGKEGFNRLVMNAKITLEQAGSEGKRG